MRYTTVIDISEIQQVYRNMATRVLYVHMCLKCGYHDVDRDILDLSLRQLAAGAGLSLSATRHGLKILESAGLVRRQGAAWIVRKWLPEQSISQRPKTQREQRQIDAAVERKRQEAERDRADLVDRALREQQWAQGASPYQLYLQQLEAKANAGDSEAAEALQRHREMNKRRELEEQKEGTGSNKQKSRS